MNTTFKTLLFAGIVLLGSTGPSNGQEWDFLCSALAERHVHEDHCYRYYECAEDDVGNWIIEVNSCPAGRIYSEEQGRCVDGACPHVTTEDPCSRIQSSTNYWDFQCVEFLETYPHERDCSRFYECFEDDVGNWVIQLLTCSLGKYYDPSTKRCVTGTCPTPSPIDCSTNPYSTASSYPSWPTDSPSSPYPSWPTDSPSSPYPSWPTDSPSSPYPSWPTDSPSSPYPSWPTDSPSSPNPSWPTGNPTHSPTWWPTTDNTEIPPPDFKCPSTGTFPDPYNCREFHICEINESGTLIGTKFQCAGNFNFCQTLGACSTCPCSIPS